MAATFATASLNSALDALTMTYMTLHSASPGTDGSNLAAGCTKTACTFNAAGSAERVLNADVAFTGLTANTSVTHFGVWNGNSPGTYIGGDAIDSGDTTANAAGEYTVKATTTKFTAAGG
jgi:hypothetical protein